MDAKDVHDLAARQRGLIAVRQARTLGLPQSSLASFVVRRGWSPVERGIWLAPGAPPPPQMALRAALLRLGAPAAATGWTAAALHGLHPPSALMQILVPAQRRAPSLRRVEVLRTRHWAEGDVLVRDGVPTVTVARAVRDLAPSADLDALRQLVIDGRQRRLLRLEEVVRHVATSRSLAGRRKLVRVLRELDSEVVDSEFERLVAAWLRAEGHPVVAQYQLRTSGRVLSLDLALPDRRVAIECQGFGGHATRRQQNVDSVRTKAILAAGWVVVPVTWDEYVSRQPGVLGTLDQVRAPQTTRPCAS